jgi:hypothetical protein
MTHTPEPWGYDGTGCIYSDALPRGECVIADMQDGSTDWEADAWLMAAAPELLAAARLANQELIDLGQGSSGSRALPALWAAIAKAEGRE